MVVWSSRWGRREGFSMILSGLADQPKSKTTGKVNDHTLHGTNIRLMEEILHQWIRSLSHYFKDFIDLRWCRNSSINSIPPNGTRKIIDSNVIFDGICDRSQEGINTPSWRNDWITSTKKPFRGCDTLSAYENHQLKKTSGKMSESNQDGYSLEV